jgi:hypothetical protein
MKKYILLLLIAFLSVHLLAQDKNQFNPVNTGVNSLGIAPDSRGGGMGDVGAATDPDVNSQFWNPAKYPFTISRAGVAVSYTPWLRKLVNDMTWHIWQGTIASEIIRQSAVLCAISLWGKYRGIYR